MHMSPPHAPVDTVSPLPPERDVVPIGDLTSLLLSPDAGARKFQCACPRGALSSPHRGRGGVRGIRFLGSIRDKFVVQSLPNSESTRGMGRGESNKHSTISGIE